MASAAPTLKHLTLELGGNDAAIVMPDVDVAKTARKLFMDAFLNSGQVCIAAKRIYVHDSIYDAFAQAFALQGLGIGSEQRTDAAKLRNQLLRLRFRVAARNSQREQIFDQLMVEQSLWPAFEKAAPQAGAVP